MALSNPSADPVFEKKVAGFVRQLATDSARRVDQLFAGLMLMQWAICVVAALAISPTTWIGYTQSLSQNLWFAFVGGAALSSLPVWLVWRCPGALTTRLVIACCQMLFAALLIHVTGGRLETHFHVFISLVLLAAYRDWRVLMLATLVIAIDHYFRSIWWPESVFGVSAVSPLRWLEHVGWVLAADLFLMITIRWGLEVQEEIARKTTRIEMAVEELARAKAQAEAANRAKSEFLANMSHEIRTPLNGILGFTELLIRGGDGGNEQERIDFLKTIRSSGKHLLQLLNDVLDISKIEAGQLQIESITCSPHQLLADVVSVMRVPAQKKGITLDYRWESGIPETIQSDPHRLKQLLMNLVNNAIKFTDEGSVVVVAKLLETEAAAMLQFDVRDTGIGIAIDKLETIFLPFVQADSSVTRKYGGTGLGLAISHRIAKSLGGDLRVESDLGHGSTFTVIVPTGDLSGVSVSTCPAPAMAGDVVRCSPGHESLDGMKILVVDDGETNRKLISLFLTRSGATVAIAENGALAVHAVQTDAFDAVLMDMQMPVMDGYTATRRIRGNGYQGPIIALTAHAMKGDRERCEAAGCSGYLAKPVNMDELVRTVRQAAGLVRVAPDVCKADYQFNRDGAIATKSRVPINRSTLPTDDPEIREVVAEFIDSVNQRLDALSEALISENYEELVRVAHALKGSGGTAGFSCFTDPAGRIEMLAKAHESLGIQAAIGEIRTLQQQVSV